MPRHLDVNDAIETIAFSYSGPVAVGQGVSEVLVPMDCEVISVSARASTGPVGANLIADVMVNGASIWLNSADRLIISDGGNNAASGVISNGGIISGGVLRVDIAQVGSTTAGSDLVVVVRVLRTYP